MTHPRKNIRAALVAILGAASLPGDPTIVSNRAAKIDESDLPVVNIVATPETSAESELGTPKLRRTLEVTIEVQAMASAETTLDDTLDDLAEGIEAALSADQAWNRTVIISTLTGTAITKTDDGAEPVGTMTMKYTADYYA